MKISVKTIQTAFLLLFSLALTSQAQWRAEQAVYAKAQHITRDDFPVMTRTPRGARIYAVRPPSEAMLDSIDRGLSDLFDAARRNKLRAKLNYSDYTIFIARADKQVIDGRYSPALAVPSGQYAGSDYDQGGFIYAAGMVLGYNPAAFVISEHERNFESVAEVVRFEGEHIVLYHNNRRLYRQTADHSQGGGHPILK